MALANGFPVSDWVVDKVVFPYFVPFGLEVIIRFVVSFFQADWRVFGGATLAMSTGLFLSVMRDTLQKNKSRTIDHPAVNRFCTGLMILAMSFFVLFGIITAFNATVVFYGVGVASDIEHLFELISWLCAPLAIIYSLKVISSLTHGRVG
jgi:hypothetical protein